MSGARLRYVMRVLSASVLNRRSRLMLVIAALTLVSMLATTLVVVSQGAGKQLGEGLKMFGANVTVAPPVRATGAGGIETGSLDSFLDVRQVEPVLSATQGVESFSPRVELPQAVNGVDSRLVGLPLAEMETAKWKLTGALPASGQVLVGRDLAARLGISTGAIIVLGDVKAPVSGVVETGAAEDDQVLSLIDDAKTLTGGGVSRYLVRVDPEALDSVVAQLQKQLPQLEVRTLRQVAESEGRLLDRVAVLLLVVTIGVAVSAAIAVGTTLNLVVLERGEEIGLLKAMGGTSGLVVGYFLLEQVSSALVAGLAGAVLGTLAAQAVSLSVFGAPLPFTLIGIPVGVGISLAIVLVAGAVPVVRASRVESAEALRGL